VKVRKEDHGQHSPRRAWVHSKAVRWSLDCLSVEDAKNYLKYLWESSWSAFIVSTRNMPPGCGLSCGRMDWLHPWVCMIVPSLDGCVLRLLLCVPAHHDVITS
jgi:hypothetical protein